MNAMIIQNFSKLRPFWLLLPLASLGAVAIFLLANGVNSPTGYVEFQKEYFLRWNAKLSAFRSVEYNLTQLGDAFVCLCFLTPFYLKAPKLWQGLALGLLVSVVFSVSLKEFIDVPRPYTYFSQTGQLFTIIGKKAVGVASLPSGHSISIFMMLTVLYCAFAQGRFFSRTLWALGALLVGVAVISSRVGVGAHYPLDTLFGSLIGILSGLLGVLLANRFPKNLFANPKSYPFFLLIFIVSLGVMIYKIMQEALLVYFLAGLALLLAIYQMLFYYVKK